MYRVAARSGGATRRSMFCSSQKSRAVGSEWARPAFEVPEDFALVVQE
jgi:hypothetical protein